MAESVKVPQDEPSPPPYTEQPAGGAPSGYQSQPGYPAEVNQPPPKGGYLAPQPYNTRPAPGPHPFAVQHGYPLQTMQPVPVQQTSTVIMQAPQAVILPAAPRPSSWLGLSIFTFLCCVWPIGLAAIIFSCMVDSAYASGDYEGARRNSNIAKWLNVAAILCGIGLIVFLIVQFAVLAARVSASVP